MDLQRLGELGPAALAGLAVLLLVLLLFKILPGRRVMATEPEDVTHARLVIALSLIDSHAISLPESWQKAVRAEARHALANAIMLTVNAVNAEPAPSDEIDEYRRAVVVRVTEAFRSWRKDA